MRSNLRQAGKEGNPQHSLMGEERLLRSRWEFAEGIGSHRKPGGGKAAFWGERGKGDCSLAKSAQKVLTNLTAPLTGRRGGEATFTLFGGEITAKGRKTGGRTWSPERQLAR